MTVECVRHENGINRVVRVHSLLPTNGSTASPQSTGVRREGDRRAHTATAQRHKRIPYSRRTTFRLRRRRRSTHDAAADKAIPKRGFPPLLAPQYVAIVTANRAIASAGHGPVVVERRRGET
jgi:hypothetical protein